MDTTRPDDEAAGWPAAGGEMAQRLRLHDWAATALGPIGAWPQPLRTAVDICLACGFASFVWWGPDLVQLYNDAARSVLGHRHPDALGLPAAQAWLSAWAKLGPVAERVMQTGQALTGTLAMRSEPDLRGERAGMSCSFSPLRDGSGAVAGVLLIAVPGLQSPARPQDEEQRPPLAREPGAGLAARPAAAACMPGRCSPAASGPRCGSTRCA